MSDRVTMIGDLIDAGIGPAAFGLGADAGAVRLEQLIKRAWIDAGHQLTPNCLRDVEFLQFRANYMSQCHLQRDARGCTLISVCDVCRCKPICGIRYTCSEQCGFDCCERCVEKNRHEHELEPIAPPSGAALKSNTLKNACVDTKCAQSPSHLEEEDSSSNSDVYSGDECYNASGNDDEDEDAAEDRNHFCVVQ